MSAHRVVMHVGAAKAGSSALQRAVGDERWRGGDRPFTYARWRADGALDLAPEPHPLMGYAYSELSLADLVALAPADRERLVRDARSVRGTLVLSSEGWGSEVGRRAADPDFVARCREVFGPEGLAARAVLYVRPQAAWVESFYLQFAIWTGVDVDWCSQGLRNSREGFWAARAEALSAAGFDVSVRYAPDVAGDFLTGVLGVSPDDPRVRLVSTANRRVSLDLLVLMLNHPQLRPDQHAPHVEFLAERLSDEWGLPERPVPPLVGEQLCDRIVEVYADDNRRLMGLLPAEQAAAFARDAEEFSRSRRGVPLVTRADLAAIPVLPEYLEALLAHSLDEVMRARFGGGIPGMVAPDAPVAPRRGRLAR